MSLVGFNHRWIPLIPYEYFNGYIFSPRQGLLGQGINRHLLRKLPSVIPGRKKFAACGTGNFVQCHYHKTFITIFIVKFLMKLCLAK